MKLSCVITKHILRLFSSICVLPMRHFPNVKPQLNRLFYRPQPKRKNFIAFDQDNSMIITCERIWKSVMFIHTWWKEIFIFSRLFISLGKSAKPHITFYRLRLVCDEENAFCVTLQPQIKMKSNDRWNTEIYHTNVPFYLKKNIHGVTMNNPK